MAGALVEVGRGKLASKSFAELLDGRAGERRTGRAAARALI